MAFACLLTLLAVEGSLLSLFFWIFASALEIRPAWLAQVAMLVAFLAFPAAAWFSADRIIRLFSR